MRIDRSNKFLAIAYATIFATCCFSLRPAQADNQPTVGELRGAVTKDDKPAPGISIRIVHDKPDDGDAKKRPSGIDYSQTVKQTNTDNNGHFAVTLPPGAYLVYAGVSPSMGKGRAKATVVAGESVEVSITLKVSERKK